MRLWAHWHGEEWILDESERVEVEKGDVVGSGRG